MNTEREAAILVAANMLANTPIDLMNEEDVSTIIKHGSLIGAFICGVRWADKNPESPWVNIEERMPENSIPEVSDQSRSRAYIKVMVMLMNGNIMQADRRRSIEGTWYFNIPLRMREQITHWMPIPPAPSIANDLN